jgi:uncharacterized membrane protein YphA (DoxX/SURF4 family)
MLGLEFSFFGKHTLFRGPLGWFLRHMGGIPLDRSRNQSFVSQAVSWFEGRNAFALGVAPEGTRRLTGGWKTGFYYIALQAKVPIYLGYIDYAKKEAGILPDVLVPTGDIEKDFEVLTRLYGPRTAKHPEWKAPIMPLGSAPREPTTGGSEQKAVTEIGTATSQTEPEEEENPSMTPIDIVRKASALALKVLGYLDFVPGVLTRLVVGFAFYDSGKGKLDNMENTVNFFTDLGIPFPDLNAVFVARLEYYGGMLLLAGLLTRIVALLLSSTMIGALITADRGTFLDALTRSSEIGLSDVAPFVLGVFLSWLVVKGPGALSVDHLLKRILGKSPEPEKAG